jgi:hypothetical protein
VKSVVAALYLAILLIVLAYLIGEATALQIFVEPLVGVNDIFVVHIFYISCFIVSLYTPNSNSSKLGHFFFALLFLRFVPLSLREETLTSFPRNLVYIHAAINTLLAVALTAVVVNAKVALRLIICS